MDGFILACYVEAKFAAVADLFQLQAHRRIIVCPASGR
jgi:hypothetical protein